MIEFVRTPESFFADLKEFSYQPKYLLNLPGTDNARLAYIDEGTNTHGIALFLHGNPTWSYCYRKMIPIMVRAGFRAIAPDMIGFGRSDKPIQQSWHTFMRHYHILLSFIEHLDLKNITLICHDWGGLFGLNIVPAMAVRFRRIIVLNTMLSTGKNMPESWHQWVKYNNLQHNLNPVECLVSTGCKLSNDEQYGFLAPYPTAFYKAAFRQFPNLMPNDKNCAEGTLGKYSEYFWKNNWEGESFVAVGDTDPILADATKNLAYNIIRDCPEPMIITDTGHFLFEQGDQILESALKVFSL